MKTCTIFKTEFSFILLCEHKTVAGFRVIAEPFDCIPTAISSESLGTAVLKSLGSSMSNVPVPDANEMKRRLTAALKLAGVKSWKGLVEKAKACGVEFDGVKVAITPHIRGEKNAYFPDNANREEVPAVALNIGESVLRGFSQSS